jgi:hypothetical protein
VLLAIVTLKAQAPQSIPYQAVARNAAGNLIAGRNVALRFTIHDVTSGGTVVYRETQSTGTNALGLFSVNIGAGTPVTGTFAGINWGSGAKFAQVEIDTANGSNYVDMGTQQLMSVPYALYAQTSGGGIANGSAAGNTPYWDGSNWVNNSNIYNGGNGNNNGADVGINTSTPHSALEVNGSFGVGFSSQQFGVIDISSMVYLLTSPFFGSSINLPSPSTFSNRMIVIINSTGSSKTFSPYLYKDLSGTAQGQIANGTSLWLISTSTFWQQVK